MFSLRTLFSEGWANLRSEGWRLPAFLLVLGSVAFGSVALDLDVADQTVGLSRELKAAGDTVWTATQAGDLAIDTDACLGLGESSSVARVAGSTAGETSSLRKAADHQFVINRYVGDLPTLLADNTSVHAINAFTADSLARQLGIAGGTTVELRDGRTLANVHTLDISERLPDAGSQIWVREPSPPSVTTCWIEFTQRTPEQPDVLHSALDVPESPVLIQPLLGEERFRPDPLVTFQTRPTRYAWLVGGVVSAILISIPSFFRRHWVALYLSVGASRSQVFLILMAAAIPLILASALIGAAAALLWFHEIPSVLPIEDALRLALRQSALQTSTTFVGVSVSMSALAAGDPSSQLRRRG